LEIHRCGIEDNGGIALAKSLSNNTSLKFLDISRNLLGDETAMCLINIIK